MQEAIEVQFKAAVLETFAKQKALGERAMAQLDDAQLHESPGAGMNTIATIVRHLSGNMLSRWTDFLTSDGEKEWRRRDEEFVDDGATREVMMMRWEQGWRAVFDAIEPLSETQLVQEVLIRGERHSVMRAILRQVDHYGYHVGQIVTFARMIKGEAWQHLSIAPGASEQFNASMGYQPRASRRA